MRVLIIRVFLVHFPLVFLIDREDVLAWSLDFHSEIAGLVPVAFATNGIMHEGRVKLADDDLPEKCPEILPTHIERSVLGILVVVVFVSEVLGPFVGGKGPVPFPNELAPGIPKFD